MFVCIILFCLIYKYFYYYRWWVRGCHPYRKWNCSYVHGYNRIYITRNLNFEFIQVKVLSHLTGHLTENCISDPFVHIRVRFLFDSHSAKALCVRLGPFSPMESFGNGLNRTRATAGCTVTMHWHTLVIRQHTFCSEFVHSLSGNFPVCIR